MKTQTVILTAKYDDNLGTVGLVLPGMDSSANINPSTDGGGIAHDLLEHMNGPGEIGDITDELEAMGAMWFVRGQYHDLSRDGARSAYSVYENMAADLTRMFSYFYYGSYVDLRAPRTRPCDADADLQDIVNIAHRDMLDEINDGSKPLKERVKRREFTAVCLPRMRIGYRKAVKKYPSARVANNLFWLVAEAVDPYAKHAATEYELVYGTDKHGRAFARCSEHYEEEY